MTMSDSKLPNSADAFFDSTKMGNVEPPKSRSLPGYYFPLVAGIILAEVVVLVLALLNILPIHPFEVYSEALYFQYIGSSDLSHIAVTITRWFFFLLTAGVLIPVTLIIILEVTRRVINSRRGESNAWDEEYSWLDRLDKNKDKIALAPERIQGDYVTRFDIHQRIQHIALMASFIVLAVTGVLRGFPTWPTFQWFTGIFGGSDILRLVHDGAAFVMIVDGLYHIGYIAYGIVVQHKFPKAMLPNLKDLKDIIHSFLWILGQHRHEPQYERFQYGQKIDYWAIFWGMPVMVITGMIMMLPAFFSQHLSGWAFAVVATAHRDESVLAIGFIAIVHMYYGHLQTTAFPVNTVMFTGKMLKSKYRQWFGREYFQITGEKVE
jgi:cytochrome b subunit of formate dehydrogenase